MNVNLNTCTDLELARLVCIIQAELEIVKNKYNIVINTINKRITNLDESILKSI
jgi:hypothetical protein